MKELNHPCVIKMRHAFYTKGTKVGPAYFSKINFILTWSWTISRRQSIE